MSADAVNWKWSAEHVGYTIIDIAAIIPGCDILKGLKYTDEIFMIVKRGDKEILIAAEKASEQLLKNDEVIGYAAKHGDELITAVGKGCFASPNNISKLLDKMPELSGTTRDKLLGIVQDSELNKIVNELYRPGAIVGDGGTAAILVEEFNNRKTTHLIKAKERLKQLKALVSSNTLKLGDLDVAEALIDDLEYAIGLFD